jgi:hypothetical protein
MVRETKKSYLKLMKIISKDAKTVSELENIKFTNNDYLNYFISILKKLQKLPIKRLFSMLLATGIES